MLPKYFILKKLKFQLSKGLFLNLKIGYFLTTYQVDCLVKEDNIKESIFLLTFDCPEILR